MILNRYNKLKKRHLYYLLFILATVTIFLLTNSIINLDSNKAFLVDNNTNKIDGDNEWLDVSDGRIYADYGDNTCKQNPYRKTLKEIFKRWTEIATEHDIKYFLFAGTLLGAWRNGDVIPHDTDMDLLIDRKDAVKLEAIATPRNSSFYDSQFGLAIQFDYRLPNEKRKRVRCNGETVDHMNDACSFQDPLARLIKGGLYLDIYDYYWKDGVIHEDAEYPKTYKTEDVFPIKKCRFLDMDTFCPNNTRANLWVWYKDDLYPQKKCKNGTWLPT